MKSIPGASLVLALAIFSIQADAIELICPLTGKVFTTGKQVSQEDMENGNELRIDDSSNGATLSGVVLPRVRIELRVITTTLTT